jgi:hypothetical protein
VHLQPGMTFKTTAIGHMAVNRIGSDRIAESHPPSRVHNGRSCRLLESGARKNDRAHGRIFIVKRAWEGESRLPAGSPPRVDQRALQRTHEDKPKGVNPNQISVLDQQVASYRCVSKTGLKGFESLPHRQKTDEFRNNFSHFTYC